MHNLNFLPEYIKNRHQNKKNKVYKTFFFLLWMLSLILFMTFVYFKYRRNELIINNLSNNSKIAERTQEESNRQFKNDTLVTLSRFIKDFNNHLAYKNVVINDTQMDMDIVIKDKKEYYELIKSIENSSNYSIHQISPIIKENEKLTFKLVIEVK